MNNQNHNNLEDFRSELDLLDDQIIEYVGKRFKTIKDIAVFKKENEIPMMQPNRINKVEDKYVSKGKSYSMNEEFMKKLYQLILEESCREEDKIIDK